MAIHDVDKNGSERNNPAVNAHDTQDPTQRMAHGTTSFDPKTDATTAAGYLQSKNGRLLGNNGTNNLGLFGFDDAGNMVVKVAKPGYDANSAANANLIFNSAQNVFKIVNIITTTVTIGSVSGPIGGGYASTSATAQTAHGLGSPPILLGFVNNGTGYVLLPYTQTSITDKDRVSFLTFDVYADSTYVYSNISRLIQSPVGSSWSGGPFTYKIYILQETAS